MADGNGTGKTEMQEMILDVLREIRDEQSEMKDKLDQLTLDVHTVHEFQKGFGERLSIVEQFCIDTPLRSARPSPPPKKAPSIVPGRKVR